MKPNHFHLPSSVRLRISQALIITIFTLLCLPVTSFARSGKAATRSKTVAPLAGMIEVNVSNDADNLDANTVTYETIDVDGSLAFVVRWHSKLHCHEGKIDVRAMLHADGDIDVCYVDTHVPPDINCADNASHSHGLQAVISPVSGFWWMRRLPRRVNLKCLTALVT